MARNNDKIWKISRIVVPLILAMAGFVYAYGRLNGRVETIETQVIKVDANEKAIIGLQKDVEYIREAVDRIEKKL